MHAGLSPTPQTGNRAAVPTSLILQSGQSPGDIVMMTVPVVEIQRQYPGRYRIDVRTSVPAIWEHNPFITPIRDGDPSARVLAMNYELIHVSNQRPVSFLEGFCEDLAQKLGLPSLRPHEFHGHIFLSEEERSWMNQVQDETGYEGRFWLVNAGRKNDFTAKQWPIESFQEVVDHFIGRLTFVQIGAAEHVHPPLKNVIDLRGRTDHRQLIRLVHHASGVLTGVSYSMHLSAAVPRPTWMQGLRPCVVVAGGREPVQWEMYPGHQFLHTIGALSCCATGGCWKSRAVALGDGDPKDHDLCLQPVDGYPRCMRLIRPADVIRAIEMYHEGGAAEYARQGADQAATEITVPHDGAPRDGAPRDGAPRDGAPRDGAPRDGAPRDGASRDSTAQRIAEHDDRRFFRSLFPAPAPPANGRLAARAGQPTVPVFIDFRHGLGDAVQFTGVLAHLRHYHSEWEIDLAVGIGKHSAFTGLCRRVFIREREQPDRAAYRQALELSWDECPTCYSNSPSTKAEHCLRTVFHLEPLPELCRYQIAVSEEAADAARAYLREIGAAGPRSDGRYAAAVMHYEGNTSAGQKNLPHEVVARLCETIITMGFRPVILDWDGRSPLPDGVRIFNPGVAHPLWQRTGTGDAEVTAALIGQAALMIGIDSGPLHVAAATLTPMSYFPKSLPQKMDK